MPRTVTRASQFLIDLCVLAVAFGIAFLLRFDWMPPKDMMGRLILVLPYVVVLEYCVLVAFGVHRFSWRYIGLREVARILGALVTASAILLLSRLFVGVWQDDLVYLRHGVVPLGVIGGNFLLGFLAITGVRVIRRLLGERAEVRSRVTDKKSIPTILIGAGQAGVMVAKELQGRPELSLKPIGFIDDDPTKQGTLVHGVRVIGKTENLATLCKEYGAEQIVISIANAPGGDIRRIAELAEEADIPCKIIPGIYEIVGGQVNLSRIRDVAIEDLLGRDPIELDGEAISNFVEGRVVVVTGAGGSIGSEICRQIAPFKPRCLVLVEQAENSLFHIHNELLRKFPDVDVMPRVADVTDQERMNAIFTEHPPSAVFHAAAHKHVPMMEWNPGEAVKNNVFGTGIVAELAHKHQADAFVMISTDKAVNPTSVMGTTKRVAEMYVQSLAERSDTRFVTVRFGNVLGSAGSVIPIFKDQIERGGPITVTHPEMQRYFMTIPEACQLVLQAGTMGQGGEIFILDMGKPVKIVDLARDLIKLSGLREGEDINIVFSGMRPGEKLFEELSTSSESAEKTQHPKIFIGRQRKYALSVVETHLERLRALPNTSTPATIRATLRTVVPEYDSPEMSESGMHSSPPAAGKTTEKKVNIPTLYPGTSQQLSAD